MRDLAAASVGKTNAKLTPILREESQTGIKNCLYTVTQTPIFALISWRIFSNIQFLWYAQKTHTHTDIHEHKHTFIFRNTLYSYKHSWYNVCIVYTARSNPSFIIAYRVKKIFLAFESGDIFQTPCTLEATLDIPEHHLRTQQRSAFMSG